MVDDDFDDALGAAIGGEVGQDTSDEGNEGDTGNTGNAGDAQNTGDRKNVKNYPFYISEGLREDLDQLYNQYDGKNKVEGGEGIEKHAEFLEPVMRAAIDDLDLDDVVPYESEE